MKGRITTKANGWNHHMEGKREGQRKAKRHVACMNQRRELILFTVGSYLTHNLLMSPTFKSWNLIVIRGLKQASPANAIFLSIAKAKAHWKAMLARYLKNWMQKNKDEWPPNHLSWKRRAHSLMKWCISHLGAPCTSMAIKIKWCLSWIPLYLRILAITLNFTTTPTSQVITFVATIFHVKSITTTSTTKT